MDIIRLSITRPIAITMATIFLVALGVIGLSRLPLDLYPSVTYPVLAVRASLAGAAPEEMEQLVTKRMEDVLATIPGVEKLRSISRSGQSVVILEFASGIDVRFQEMQVRAKIANIRGSLPEDLSEPSVYRQDPDDNPIIELAVTGDRTASQLTDLVEDDIARRLRQIPGVGEVTLGGDLLPEIKVEMRRSALEGWNIDSRSVVEAIRRQAASDPAGQLEGQERNWVLRALSPVKIAKDLEEVRVADDGTGGPVFVRDVARVSSGFQERSSYSFLGDSAKMTPAILIDITKQSGENTLDVSKKIRSVLAELEKTLPGDIRVEITRDDADLVRINVADVTESLLIGAFLTVLVVLIFLRSPRSTFTTGLALPTSVITTFAAMALFGFTLNVMTLLALSLAVGLLVDDAIVVRENIFRHLNMNHPSASEASYRGTREVVLAVTATTLTIVAVFVPVGFMGGVTGQFFRQFALTVVFAILVSLWDAVTMAPMLSAHYANIANPEDEWRGLGRFGKLIHGWLHRFEHAFDKVGQGYGRLLAFLLPRPAIALVIALAAVGGAIYGMQLIPKSFLPAQLGDNFTIQLNGPMAMPLPKVQELGVEAHERLATLSGLDNWTIRASQGFGGNGNIRITVRIGDDRAKSQESLAKVRQEARKVLGDFAGWTVRISEPSDPLSGSSGRFQPLAITVTGESIEGIRDLARQVREIMVATAGVTDVAPIDDQGLPEVRFVANPEMAARYGITAKEISDTLRLWVEGDSSSSMRVGDDQIDIRILLEGGKSMAPAELIASSIPVKAMAVPLANVVSWEATAGPPIIARENRQRTLRIGGNIEHGAALGDVVTALNERLRELPLPSGYGVRIAGQSEQMEELQSNVVFAIGLGCAFVFMVLAALFESLAQPLTVMMAIPLAATGAIFALQIFGMSLDLYAGIGMVLLAGIVAKNSILLVDFAMQKVGEGNAEPSAAILAAAPLRLRPIVMTSLAMIAGMLPIATGLGAGGAARQTLGVATIGGIISSTILTLVVVPNLFVIVETGRRLFRDWRAKKKSAHVPGDGKEAAMAKGTL